MFKRLMTETLRHNSAQFPIIALTGPRQSGKTTLLNTLFPDYEYVNLETPDTLLQAKMDPRGFFARSHQWIIDEAQNFPELFSYLQEFSDQQHKKFLLSGSQNFLLSEKISQSLAGRVAILELLPLSYPEYMTDPNPKSNLWDLLYQGWYPRPYHEHLNIELWYKSYIRTYLERDVRSLINIKDLTKFQLFLKLCAGRHGQLLNLSELAMNCGISQPTANEWLTLLEASYILFRLQPYYKNFNKRLVKTPKLYFYDSAIVCQLLGIESADHLQLHTSRGAIFEGFVISEILKLYLAKGKTAPIYFWRDHTGLEIDIILERPEGLLAIEAKSGMTISSNFLDKLKIWQKISQSNPEDCWLIYAGQKNLELNDIKILTWEHFQEKI